jgi:uncharacterized protein YbbC (DUF1343 family)/beta-glucosidase-like glycosyl hydrolase
MYWAFKSRDHVKFLIKTLNESAKDLKIDPLLIFMDFEGGIVSRANEESGFVSVPAPYALGKLDRSACFLAGRLIGSQLKSVGINGDFAPSLDTFVKDNYILATRRFSDDTEKIFTYGTAFAKGLASTGVMPVIKHFPNLGKGGYDTHLKPVRIECTGKEFDEQVSAFIRALAQDIPAVLVYHAVIKQFGEVPASRSPLCVSFIKAHAPNALIITDDIFMGAYTDTLCPVSEAFESLKAGFHLLIFSAKPDIQIKLIKELTQLSEDFSKQEKEMHEQAIYQINLVKDKFCHEQTEKLFTDEETKSLGDYLAQRVCGAAWPENLDSLDKESSVLLLSIDLPAVRPSEPWFIAKHNGTRSSYLNDLLIEKNINVKEYILNPKDNNSCEELTQVLTADTSSATHVIVQSFFYAQGPWNENQKKWLLLLASLKEKLIVVSLGHPYEKTLVPSAKIIELGSFHKPELRATVNYLTNKKISTGADIFMKNPEKLLKKKRFGLLCHQCSRVNKKFLPKVLKEWAEKQKDRTKLFALFSPEHGLMGNVQAAKSVESSVSSEFECPVYSLYGKNIEPTDDMLKDLDIILIDLQEVGVRCFTYISTAFLMIKACARNNIPVIILDRPNPLYFLPPQGPVSKKSFVSFVGCYIGPFVHRKTLGAMAKEYSKKIVARVSVISCEGQDTDRYFWCPLIPPSPNLASIESIYSYPITVFLEGTNYSEGRGTNYPFQQIGAPWVNSYTLARVLNAQNFPGVYFEPVSFKPVSLAGRALDPKHKDHTCQGVFLHIYNPYIIVPEKISYALLKELFSLYPDKSQWLKLSGHYGIDLLSGSDSWRGKISKH